jgi:drug/metabolite transporter (DMT)-like permease
MLDRPKFPDRLLQAAAPFLFVVLWSAAYVAIRFGLPDISPLFFLTIRFALATAALVAIVALFRLPWASAKGIWHHLVIAGVLINAFYLSGAYLALQHINAATMALIAALHPLLTASMARQLLGEVMRPIQWIGLALGLAGVVLAVGGKAVQVDSLIGALIGFGGVACLALGTIHYRKYCRGADLMVANTVQSFAAGVVCALLAWSFEDIRVVWSTEVFVSLFYLAIVSSVGVLALLMFMLRRNQAGKVASNFYLIPGVTALIGWLALGETLTGLAFTGFLIASLGVWLAHREKPRLHPDHAVKRK